MVREGGWRWTGFAYKFSRTPRPSCGAQNRIGTDNRLQWVHPHSQDSNLFRSIPGGGYRWVQAYRGFQTVTAITLGIWWVRSQEGRWMPELDYWIPDTDTRVRFTGIRGRYYSTRDSTAPPDQKSARNDAEDVLRCVDKEVQNGLLGPPPRF